MNEATPVYVCYQVREIERLHRDLFTDGFRQLPISDQLVQQAHRIVEALNDPNKLYNYGTCLALSDVWIHLECVKTGVKQFVTTNFNESRVLCPAMGLTMLNANIAPTGQATV